MTAPAPPIDIPDPAQARSRWKQAGKAVRSPALEAVMSETFGGKVVNGFQYKAPSTLKALQTDNAEKLRTMPDNALTPRKVKVKRKKVDKHSTHKLQEGAERQHVW